MKYKLPRLDLSRSSSFKRNLLLGFGVSFFLLIMSSVASFVSIQRLIDRVGWVEHTNTVIRRAEGLLSSLKDAETGQRGFLLTGMENFLEPYQEALQETNDHLKALTTLTSDNHQQQLMIPRLQNMVNNRFSQLGYLINKKKRGQAISLEEMKEGKTYMDSTRILVETMISSEQELLALRSKDLDQFINITPIIILITAALSMLVTLVSFVRITRDHDNRVSLQTELEAKDRDISRRIQIIQEVAGKIAQGEYGIRTTDSGSDGLGNLSVALNKMAASLEHSFDQLAEKEWLQSGMAGLGDVMLGEKSSTELANDILSYVAAYTNSEVGAFFLSENGKDFRLESAYAFRPADEILHIQPGQGISGQAIANRKRLLVKDIPESSVQLQYTAGSIRPAEIVALPIEFEKRVIGVLELGSLHAFTPAELKYLDGIGSAIGIVLNTSSNRRRLQELLHETQSQAEELQAQQAELESINTELEIKSERLQASEEELRVQQEELLQANQELEERSHALEEKNALITERNQEIQLKAEELAISTRYKSEFLANMSHELRTPLNSILLLSRLLAENPNKNLNPDQVEYAQVIQGSGNGLLQLINEILDLSKIESGKMELEYAVLPISEPVEEIQLMFRPLANDRSINFEIKTTAATPATMETDKLRLLQILRNLLSNAFKFTEKGTVSLQIQNAPGQPGYIDFIVEDSGIGISPEKQEIIFDAFRQADGSTRRKYGGTGLGLSITRELVKLLGGSIRLDSQPEKGSRFTVTLPIQKPVAVEPENSASMDNASPAGRQAIAPFPVDQQSEAYLSKRIPENIPDDRAQVQQGDKTIVIVEDDTGFARALLNFTRQRGYKGIVAVRGDEGIELVKQFRPHGVLLDIELPVKSGWQVMEELKQNPATRHIPIHVMSGHEVRNKSLLQGAINFMNKPVDMEQMNEVFRKIEYIIEQKPRKVLIVEENTKHARALAYYLETYSINTEIRSDIKAGIEALKSEEANCVILDMGIPGRHSYDILEEVKRTPGMENLPIIIFTGKSLSRTEEMRIRQYADSIVVKTAHSYQRILDEVSLFLHLMEEQKKKDGEPGLLRSGLLRDVLQGKTVLIADDDVRNIFSLTKTLENLGMKVLPAIDGREALEQLSKHRVDIVLMDMMMPELDGYETTQRIRTHPKYKKLPVIAVTAKAMTGDREKCISAGASDYITKPVDLDQLLSLLRVWLYESNGTTF